MVIENPIGYCPNLGSLSGSISPCSLLGMLLGSVMYPDTYALS